MKKFDAARALHDARTLSYPRLVGGPAEGRARQWVQKRLSEAGVTPAHLPFTFFPALAFGMLMNFLKLGIVLLLLHRLLLCLWPHLGALLGLLLPLLGRRWWRQYRRAAAGKLQDLHLQHPWHSAFIPRAQTMLRSGNVLADLPVRGPIRHRLVLLAHTDSKSQNISIAARILSSMLFGLGIFFLPLAVAPAMLWPGWLAGAPGALWWILWSLALLGAFALLSLKVTDHSPGALDNAGSCGVLLEAARVLAADPPRGVAVRLVFTGAEELGLAGGYAYARQAIADPEWRNAVHLNFEGVGAGQRLWYTTETGPTGSYAPVGRQASELAVAACRRAGLTPKRLAKIIGGEADHIPLVESGLSAVTLMFHGRGGGKIHTAGDRPELLGEDGMAAGIRLALAAVEELEDANK